MATMGASHKIVYPEKFLKAQAKRERELIAATGNVLRIRDSYAKTKARQNQQRDKKKTSLKLTGWKNGYTIQKEPEGALRPSDRQYDIRVYSLQDKCLWTMPELGEWYNAYAKPEPVEARDPLRGGYLVPRGPKPAHVQTRRPPPRAAAPPTLSRMKTPAYHDWEANIVQQRHNAEVAVQEGKFYPPQEPGRVRGYRAAPWMDRPE